MERTRLKLTILLLVAGLSLEAFGIFMVLWNTYLGFSEANTDVWIFLGSGFAAMVTAGGFYISKETARPSFINETHVNLSQEPEDSESDDEEMPDHL